MPILKNVEKKISEIEGFDIAFIKNGKDVHGALENIPQYLYENQASGSWTITEWKQKRFKKLYPGFDVVVYDDDGNSLHGGYTLNSVRDTY